MAFWPMGLGASPSDRSPVRSAGDGRYQRIVVEDPIGIGYDKQVRDIKSDGVRRDPRPRSATEEERRNADLVQGNPLAVERNRLGPSRTRRGRRDKRADSNDCRRMASHLSY